MRAALIDQISRKSLRLSSRSRIEQTKGRLISAISSDVCFLEAAFPFVVRAIVDPLTIIVSFVLLVVNLGPSALVVSEYDLRVFPFDKRPSQGVGILLVVSPAIKLMADRLRANRKCQLKVVDKRVRLISEILQGIRSIKLYAYESYFTKRLLQYRRKELDFVRTKMRDRAIMQMIVVSRWSSELHDPLTRDVYLFKTMIPILAAVLTFITYAKTGHTLDIPTIFSSLQLFNLVQAPLRYLPVTFLNLSDAYVAAGRISEILAAEDHSSGIVTDMTSQYAVQAYGDFIYESFLAMDDKLTDMRKGAQGSIVDSEEENEVPFSLHGIELQIPRGAFVCIFGRVGSGKSALLDSLIGEMRQTRGSITIGGTIGLVTQSPWIQNASVKENILFGNAIDESRLNRGVQACALEEDIQRFPDGVETEIGGMHTGSYH